MRLTIYQKLLVFMLPIVSLSIIGLGYYSFVIARGEMVNEIRTNMHRQAEDAAKEIDRMFKQTRIDLVTISGITSIADYYSNVDYELYQEAEESRKSIERFMVEFSRRANVYSGMSFIDQKGMEVSRIVGNEIATKRRRMEEKLFFQQARILQSRNIHVSPIEQEGDSGGLILRHAISLFNDTGMFKGMITLDLDFRAIQAYINGLRVGHTGHAYLLDHEGRIVSSTEIKQMMDPSVVPPSIALPVEEISASKNKGSQGWMIFPTSKGDYLVGYASVELPQWSIAISVPVSESMTKISQIKVNSILALLFFMLLAAIGILVIARSLSLPIKDLAHYTRRISNGDFDQQIAVKSSDEIGELAVSFNEMTRKLKSSQLEIERWNRDLEERVRRTTAELTTEKDKLEGVFQHMADGVIVLDQYSKVIDLNAAAKAFLGDEQTRLVGNQILVVEGTRSEVSTAEKNLRLICEPRFDEGYLRCWEYFNCSKHNCSGYESTELRCWLLHGTQCDHSQNVEQPDELNRNGCRRCRLFMEIRGKYKGSKHNDPSEVALDTPKRNLRIFKSPMFDNQNDFMGHVIVLQDITKDKELERMKSEFVSNVSHELKTPLTSIRSFSEMILDDFGKMDIETQKRFLGIIRDEAERLTRLISDILDLQRIQTSMMKWNMEIIQISQIIKNSMDTFLGMAEARQMNLTWDCKGELPLICGDRDRLKQVLVNLISNAIKFNKESGQITVEAAEAPEGVLVSVSDEGIGIPVDKRGRLFERFYQVDGSATKERGGTGLGLAISKEIIEHHGGRIWLDSNRGEGCRFSFIIPRASGDSISHLSG